MPNIEMVTAIVGIVATIATVVLGYKKLVNDTVARAESNRNASREADEKRQKEFRDQLSEQFKTLHDRVAVQGEQILALHEKLTISMRAQRKAEQHFADCDRDLTEIKARLASSS